MSIGGWIEILIFLAVMGLVLYFLRHVLNTTLIVVFAFIALAAVFGYITFSLTVPDISGGLLRSTWDALYLVTAPVRSFFGVTIE